MFDCCVDVHRYLIHLYPTSPLEHKHHSFSLDVEQRKTTALEREKLSRTVELLVPNEDEEVTMRWVYHIMMCYDVHDLSLCFSSSSLPARRRDAKQEIKGASAITRKKRRRGHSIGRGH